jgi:hypothetical protein
VKSRGLRRRIAVTTSVAVTSLAAFAAMGGTGVAGGPGSGNSQYAPGYANGQKITVCHKGKTIRVALVSWKGHEKHGDTKGACVTAGATSATKDKNKPSTETSTSTSTSKGKSNGKAKGKNK